MGKMLDLDRDWIDFECPACTYQAEIQLIEVKLESKVYCHNCKSEIKFSDQNASVYLGINKINAALENFQNSLNNLFK